jgi:hypothetical protein
MRRGIALRLSIMVLSAAGLIFALMSGVGYYLAREMLLKNAEENARNQAQALVQKNRVQAGAHSARAPEPGLRAGRGPA